MRTFKGKIVGEGEAPRVKAFLFKGQEGCFIASIFFAKNDSECLLLDHFYLSGLVLGQTTGEDRCSKLKDASDTGLENFQKLVLGAAEGLKPDQDPKFTCGPFDDVIQMWTPTEIA